MPDLLPEACLADIRALGEASHSAHLCLYQNQSLLINDAYVPTAVDVFAVQKGIVTLLIGMAEQKYLLETIDHVNHLIAPEWTRLSPWDEAKISIETLLTMTTGMNDALEAEGEINVTWRYNNTAYQYLKNILCEQTELDLGQLSQNWLFKPLGMRESEWRDRGDTNPDGLVVTALHSTAADLAQIGLLVLANGRFAEQQLVEQHFIEKMSAPGSAENPAWGWGWWNNRSAHHIVPMRTATRRDGCILPDAPVDLIAARGAYENYLHVVPSMNLVIARTNATKGERHGFERELWKIIRRYQ